MDNWQSWVDGWIYRHLLYLYYNIYRRLYYFSSVWILFDSFNHTSHWWIDKYIFIYDRTQKRTEHDFDWEQTSINITNLCPASQEDVYFNGKWIIFCACSKKECPTLACIKWIYQRSLPWKTYWIHPDLMLAYKLVGGAPKTSSILAFSLFCSFLRLKIKKRFEESTWIAISIWIF